MAIGRGLAVVAALLTAALTPAEAYDNVYRSAMAATPRMVASADPFSALVGKRRESARSAEAAPVVERYVFATDDRVFLFQAGQGEGRLKFLCGDRDRRIDCLIDESTPAEEIYLLTPTRAPRGDVIWRDTRGEVLLRVSAFGGATVFWPGDPRGHAAAKSFGEDPALVLDYVTIDAARARAQKATALLSAKTSTPLVFDIGANPTADSQGGATVLADAVARAAKAIEIVAADETGARVVGAKIGRVLFRPATTADVKLEGDALVVDYNPFLDVVGRPSSSVIARFLEDSL
jgi:hypothetical protein